MEWDEGWEKGQDGRSEEPGNSPRSMEAVSELECSASLPFFGEDRHRKLAVLLNKDPQNLILAVSHHIPG